jgi:tryptophan-rich sensory protein
MRFFNRSQLGWLLGFLGASFGAAGLGGLFAARSVNTWHRTLRKPAWTPPDAAFGPVWTLLYALIAIAGWIVRRKACEIRRWPRQRRPLIAPGWHSWC